MPTIFLLGGTGYIGGPLLLSLLRTYPPSQQNKILVLTRHPAHLSQLSSLGATPVQGSFDDLEVIKRYSKQADLVINAGDSDALVTVNTILTALNERGESKRGKFVHVSGAANFLDGGREGVWKEGKVWDDGSEQAIRDIHEGMTHGKVDTTILRFPATHVSSYIVCPCGVNGDSTLLQRLRSSNPGAAKIFKTDSAMHRALVGNVLQLGYVPSVGKGNNVFCGVHVDDIVSLIHTVVQLAISDPSPSPSSKFNPYTHYYIGKGSSFEWRDANVKLARILNERGEIREGRPRDVSVDKGAGYMGHYIAANLHVASSRARSLGWRPVKDEEEGLNFVKTLEGDVDNVLKAL